MSAALPAPPLSATTAKAPSKPKPVNVFSNDGSFLERFQRSRQEEEDRRKAEEALANKRQFADRFKHRGKRARLPDSSNAVTSTDLDPNPVKKPKLGNNDTADDSAPRDVEYQRPTGRVLKNTSTSSNAGGPLVK